MGMKKLVTLLGGICLALMVVALVFASGCASTTPATSPKPAPTAPVPSPAPSPAAPKELKMTVLPLGSLGYNLMLGIGQAVKDKAGLQLRIIPGGSELARLLPARAGEAHFCLVIGASAYFTSHGIGTYAVEEWGPQPLRTVWNGQGGGTVMITRGDAGIKTLADLKGKKLAHVPGSMQFERTHEGILAFANLTIKDVTLVPVASSAAGFKAIQDGAADSMALAATAAGAYELATSPRGIYCIPIPHADNEAWKRLLKVAPFYTKLVAREGAGPQFEKGGSVECATLPYPVLAYPWVPAETSYVFAKAVWESFDLYKDKAPGLNYWTHEQTLFYKVLSYPYHDGTVKFFKEIKVWTPAMEEWQNKQVKLEQARLNAWPQAQKAAVDKKIRLDTPEFAKFWEDWLKDNNLISYPEL